VSSTVDGFSRLTDELARAFGAGVAESWPQARFEEWALRVFAFQFEANPVYRRFCLARGRDPRSVSHWHDVPLVPTSAFKVLDLATGPTEATFQTSGTTGGVGRRGRHGVRSLALYRASALPPLRAHLLPGGGRIRILSLVPSVANAPESSLARMIQFAFEDFGAPGGGTFVIPERGVEREAFGAALAEAVATQTPVWIAGTAFAFVHWLDAVRAGRASTVELPAGSAIMETGGFKGRSREIAREELYGELERVFGLPQAWIVNEYGMTELLSQFYDTEAGMDPDRPLSERRHRAPPWMRTRVLDPESLEPLPEGELGVLAHYDLANLGSVSAVLTEDLGVADADGRFRLSGRAPGAEPRGCSLALEDLLRATGATHGQ
jgi:hypothetical protein